MPANYSPLQPTGNGLQSVYLTEVSQSFVEVLGGLIGPEASMFLYSTSVQAERLVPDVPRPLVGDDLDYWEHHLEQ